MKRERDDHIDSKDPKRQRGADSSSGGGGRSSTPSSSSTPLNPDAVAAMIEQKKREIQAKMSAITAKVSTGPLGAGNVASMSTSATQSRSAIGASSASAALNVDEIKRKMEEAKERIKSSMGNVLTSASVTPSPAARLIPPDDKSKKGLKMEVHPLFNKDGTADITSILSLIPKGNFATAKANRNLSEKKAGAGKGGKPVPDKNAAAVAATMAAAAPEPEQPQPEEKKELQILEPEPELFDPSKNKFFDPKISAKAAMPKQRVAGKAFKFIQKGKFVAQANKIRQEAMLEKLKADIAATVKRAGMDVELDLVSDLSVRTQPPPAVEWWDVPLVGPDGTYESFSVNSEHVRESVTNLIHHPIPIQPPAELGAPPPKPLMLTKKERKKLRRQRRLEAQKEKQDKIRLGLLPPEQPKVRISNLMRVLGTEAVQDPTKIEALVRAQVKQRQQKHEKYINENKLTKEQKRERTRLKLLENTHVLIEVAVFKIRDLTRPQHKFKVTMNANQLNLTGVVLEHPGANLVVVEGGNRGIKQYRKLMNRRIDWSEAGLRDDVDEDAPNQTDVKPNECVMVWEGKIKRRLFQGFKVWKCPLERDIKEILEKVGALHYWDAAKHLSSEI